MEVAGPQRKAAVCREISKVHNECRRGTLEQLVSWFTENEPKGEIVVIVEGKDNGKDEDEDLGKDEFCEKREGRLTKERKTR